MKISHHYKSNRQMYNDIKAEKAFNQDVIEFADMLEQDIDTHTSDLGNKYEFNFANAEPVHLNSSSNSIGPLN